MFPRAGFEAVIAGQCVRQNTKVGRALHVVVAAEDVGSATGPAHIAEGKLQDTVGAGVVVAVGVLRATHAPDDGARTVLRHGAGNPAKLRTRHAGHVFNFFRRPLGNFLLDLVHAPDPLADIFLVFPAIFENVPQDAPDQADIRPGTEAHIFIGMGRGSGESGITDDQRRIVDFLGTQKVQQGNRVRFGRVAADDKDRTRIVNVVVGVRHRAVTPGVCNTCDRGRVTDPRLVIDVVRAPEGRELAEQVGLFVVGLGRAKPVNPIRPGGSVADLHHLVADFIDGVFPGNPGPFAVDELGRIFQPAFAVRMLAHCCALGAMGAEIERGIKSRLLADPDTVLNLSHDRTTDGTMGANGLLDFDFAIRALGMRLAHHTARQRARCRQSAHGQPGATQKRPPVNCRIR